MYDKWCEFCESEIILRWLQHLRFIGEEKYEAMTNLQNIIAF